MKARKTTSREQSAYQRGYAAGARDATNRGIAIDAAIRGGPGAGKQIVKDAAELLRFLERRRP